MDTNELAADAAELKTEKMLLDEIAVLRAERDLARAEAAAAQARVAALLGAASLKERTKATELH